MDVLSKDQPIKSDQHSESAYRFQNKTGGLPHSG